MAEAESPLIGSLVEEVVAGVANGMVWEEELDEGFVVALDGPVQGGSAEPVGGVAIDAAVD